jgi:hypothetical protein
VTDLEDLIVRMTTEIAELRRRQSQMLRRGTVHAIRKGGNEVQIKLGDDPEGQPILTPWLPVSGGNGTGAKTRHAYTVGEHVMMQNPDGDWQGAEISPSNHHKAGESPSSTPGEHVIHDGGGVRVAVHGGALKITAGGTSWTLNGSGFTQTGGSVTHDNKNIGKDHKHGGVEPGGGNTGDPT